MRKNVEFLQTVAIYARKINIPISKKRSFSLRRSSSRTNDCACKAQMSTNFGVRVQFRVTLHFSLTTSTSIRRFSAVHTALTLAKQVILLSYYSLGFSFRRSCKCDVFLANGTNAKSDFHD